MTNKKLPLAEALKKAVEPVLAAKPAEAPRPNQNRVERMLRELAGK